MTDLVKRLRDWEHVHPEDQDKTEGHLYEEAADRIEELQSRLRWVITERDDTFVRMLRRVETAEAEDKLLRDSRAEDYSELLETLDEILQGEHDVEIAASAAAIRALMAKMEQLLEVLELWRDRISGPTEMSLQTLLHITDTAIAKAKGAES